MTNTPHTPNGKAYCHRCGSTNVREETVLQPNGQEKHLHICFALDCDTVQHEIITGKRVFAVRSG